MALAEGPLVFTHHESPRSSGSTSASSDLFVIPLDDNRRWYRYHHLFADVLHTHLLDEQPDAVPGLHRRASR